MPASRGWLVIGIVALTVTAYCAVFVEDHPDLPPSQRSSLTSSQVARESARLDGIARASLPEIPPRSVSLTTPVALPDVIARSDSPRLNCQSPNDPLYDSGANEVFVDCQGSNNVTVISPVNNTVVAGVPVGNTLSASSGGITAYDPGRGEVFVANKNNTQGNTVSIISDKTNTVVATVTVGFDPSGFAYDAGKGEVFVLNVNSNDLSVIADTTNAVVATIPVGSGPNDVTYDSGKGEVFVPNWNSGTVSVVSDVTNAVVATIPVGNWPSEALYDPAKGEVFVINSYDNTVSIISDSTNGVLATVRVGSGPADMGYDSGKGEVFVSDFDSGDVRVISDASDGVVATIPTGPDPAGMTYVPAQSEVFLESIVGGPNPSVGRNISVISDSTDRIVASIPEPGLTYGAAYDPALNELFVPTFPDSVNVISTLNDTLIGTIVVGILPPTYTITFVETGLPLGSTWEVGFVACEDCYGGLFGTSRNSTLEFRGWENGTQKYIVTTTAPGFSPSVPFGNLTVRGANVTVEVVFVPAYPTVFYEANLGNTTIWSVTVQGTVLLSNGSLVRSFIETHNSTYSSLLIAFALPNGSYSYSASATGYAQVYGQVSVNGSAPAPITIAFSKPAGPWWTGNAPGWALIAAVAFAAAMIVGLVLVVRRRRRAGQ